MMSVTKGDGYRAHTGVTTVSCRKERECVLYMYHKGARLEEFMEISSIEYVENGSVIKLEGGMSMHAHNSCCHLQSRTP